ncbi:MAG: portal protein [Chloroflexi bacterium]|nr:portal protein [Chloroflexota bacterium]
MSYLWAQEGDRLATYRDADLMDAESDLAASALNAWATTATSGSLFSPQRAADGDPLGTSSVFGMAAQAGGGLLCVRAFSKFKTCPAAQAVVDQVFADCHIAERAWTLARDLRKYGDRFLEVVVDEGLRVRRLKSLPPAEIIRMEDEYGRLQPVAFRQVRNGIDVAHFAPWQIVHLRNNRQGDEKYGRSGLRTARRVWRMLSLLEDSLVSGRLQRAYNKLVHFLPVTDGATQLERQQMVQDYIRQMTTTTLIDPTTGLLDQRQNPVTTTTDFYLTVAPGDSPKTGIQCLDPANANLSQIADMEYFQNLLVAGLEVPKAYLGLERDVNSKATLGYQEIHFLRQAGSLQNTLNAGIASVLELALTLAGIDPTEVELEFLYGGS